MKKKLALLCGAILLPASTLAPAPASATDEYIFTVCDDSACTTYSCATFPNINDSGFDGTGCSVVYRYPRPREVSGE